MPLSRRYDALFERLVPMLPVGYVRALSYLESGLDSSNVTPPGAPPERGARGLMQVMNVNRRDYNAKHGTEWTSTDMLDPERNVRVFADTITRMLRVYNALDIPIHGEQGLLLVTAGWNSGYGDVKRLAEWLRHKDMSVTHDNLFRYAPYALPAASQYRWTPKKKEWQQRVVRLAMREPNDSEGSDTSGSKSC